MRFLFLINPKSGGGKGSCLIERFKKESKEISSEIDIFDLTTTNLTTKEISQYDICVVAGGDGTISRLINESDGFPIPLLILPLGTGNDLTRELGISKGILKLPLNSIINLALSYQRKEFRSWKFSFGENLTSQILFCNYISFGLDGAVIEGFDRARKHPKYLLKSFGTWGNRVAYGFYALLNLFIKSSRVEFKIGGSEIKNNGLSLLFANIRSVAGIGRSNDIGSPFDSKIEALYLKYLTHYFAIISGILVKGLRPILLTSQNELNFEILKQTMFQVDGEAGSTLFTDNRSVLIQGHCTISPGPTINVICPR